MSNLKNIKAFAFDLDGTLIDSIPDLSGSANAMREEFGMAPLPKETLLSFVGDGIGALVHRALTDSHEGKADDALWQKGYTFFMHYYSEHVTDNTTIYPGVEEGLGLLRNAGYPLVIITNKIEFLATKALKNLKLLDYFSLVIGGDTLTEKKPSAMPLKHCAEVLNVDVKEIAMVGDSKNDFLSAQNAETFSIGMSYGYDEVSQYHPDLVLDNLTKLFDVLNPKEIKY